MKRFQLLILFLVISACNLPPSLPRRSAVVLAEGELMPGASQDRQIGTLSYQEDLGERMVGDSYRGWSIPAWRVSIHRGEINSFAVSRDGARIFSAGEDGSVVETTFPRVSKVSSSGLPAAVTRVLFKGKRPVLALALSKDDELLAFARFSAIYLLNLKRKEIVAQLTKIDGRITSLSFDPRGESLAIGRSDGGAFVWNFSAAADENKDDTKFVEEYLGANSPIIRVAFHSSANALFVADRAGGIDVWRLLRIEREIGLRDPEALSDAKQSGAKKTSVNIPSGRLEDIWISPDSEEIVVSSSEGKLYRYKTRGMKLVGQGDAGRFPVFALEGVHANTIITSGREPRLEEWILKSDGTIERLRRSPLFDEPVTRLVASADYTILWGGQKTGNLVRFEIGRPLGSSN